MSTHIAAPKSFWETQPHYHQDGAGFWVMTPLLTDDGWMIWVNRGFVPHDRRAAGDRVLSRGEKRVASLLRMTQPHCAFLRGNDPAADRWYSRDTAALAQSRDLGSVAPYFIDADRGPDDALHLGGLTMVTFRNAHLGYALTWFAMAIGLAAAGIILLRQEWRKIRQ